MTFEEAIEAFRRGNFASDCLQIDLEQRASEGPLCLSGPGTIIQTQEGGVELKCFATSHEANVGIRLFNSQLHRVSGEIYADGDYYDAKAVNLGGKIWTAERFLVTNNWSLSLDAGTIIARPRAIRLESAGRGEHAHMLLVLFQQDHKQWDVLLDCTHKFELAGETISLKVKAERDDQVTIAAECAGPFPEAFERRLIEGLEFVLSTTLHPGISDITTSANRALELRSNRNPDIPIQRLPPIPTNNSQYAKDVVALLSTYLGYIHSTPDQGMWHPLTGFLNLARTASAMSLDAWALGLAVAVEGVAGEIDLDEQDGRAEHARLRAGIRDLMDEQNFSERLKNRINGFTGQLDHVRPIDRMMALVGPGEAYREDISAWRSLRNHAVHTAWPEASDISPEKLQRLLDKVYSCLRLLHMLTFRRIGYSGFFTDYATRGWPEKRYPMSSLEKLP